MSEERDDYELVRREISRLRSRLARAEAERDEAVAALRVMRDILAMDTDSAQAAFQARLSQAEAVVEAAREGLRLIGDPPGNVNRPDPRRRHAIVILHAALATYDKGDGDE